LSSAQGKNHGKKQFSIAFYGSRDFSVRKNTCDHENSME